MIRKEQAVGGVGNYDPGNYICQTDKQHTADRRPSECAHKHSPAQCADRGTGKGTLIIGKIKAQIARQHHNGGSASRRRNQRIENHTEDTSGCSSKETFFGLLPNVIRVWKRDRSKGEQKPLSVGEFQALDQQCGE